MTHEERHNFLTLLAQYRDTLIHPYIHSEVCTLYEFVMQQPPLTPGIQRDIEYYLREMETYSKFVSIRRNPRKHNATLQFIALMLQYLTSEYNWTPRI